MAFAFYQGIVIRIASMEHPEGAQTYQTFCFHWQEEGFTVISNVATCYSPARLYFLGVIYGYKIVMQLIGVVLAFSIRKVKIKGLNDSKEISIILYITSIILVIVVVITLALGDYINVNGGIFGLGISTASTVVLGCIFVPKVRM